MVRPAYLASVICTRLAYADNLIDSLFSATASPHRKYWGFQVFQKALPRVDANTMPMLFTRNLMRSWINHLSHKDRYLHKIALQVVRCHLCAVVYLCTRGTSSDEYL